MPIPEVLPATTCSVNGETKEIAKNRAVKLLPSNAIPLAMHWFNIPGHKDAHQRWHVVIAYMESVEKLKRYVTRLESK